MAQPLSVRAFRLRVALLLGLALGIGLGVLVLPPVAQDPAYHAFADGRTRFGIPNFWNVVSNLPFLPFGIWGLVALRKARFHEPREAWAYAVAFGATVLVGFGSSFYHWRPDNHTLFWDRLPMTLAFTALMSAAIAERIHARVGAGLLFPFLVLGVLAIDVWRRGELTGVGDLRFYILVQFYPMLMIPLLMALFPARYTRTRDLGWMVLWYLAAKLLELEDPAVFRLLGGAMGGHALKHLAASLSIAALAWMVARREPLEA
ncbi:MAG: ceramidase domain-containing protein [Holophagaceae bacterium]